MIENKYTVAYTDGGARGTPGPSSCAIYIPHLDMVTGQYLGIQTNNFAEYSGLLLAMEYLRGYEYVHIFMDSELVVKQMLGLYRVKSETLLPLYLKAKELSSPFRDFTISHIPREQNTHADAECNRVLDEEASRS